MDKELRIKLLVILQYTLEDYDKYKAKGAEYYSEVRYN